MIFTGDSKGRKVSSSFPFPTPHQMRLLGKIEINKLLHYIHSQRRFKFNLIIETMMENCGNFLVVGANAKRKVL